MYAFQPAVCNGSSSIKIIHPVKTTRLVGLLVVQHMGHDSLVSVPCGARFTTASASGWHSVLARGYTYAVACLLVVVLPISLMIARGLRKQSKLH